VAPYDIIVQIQNFEHVALAATFMTNGSEHRLSKFDGDVFI